jgi:hypothetical protein
MEINTIINLTNGIKENKQFWLISKFQILDFLLIKQNNY